MNEFNKNQIKLLEQELDYKFKNYDLIEEALSHPSLKQHDPLAKNYEKFEILGDSILGFLVTELIFNSSNRLNEGDIAKIKSHMVSRDVLSNIAKKIGLSQHIIMTIGEEKSNGRNSLNNLENAMEALIAAIYLDSDIIKTKLIVENLWKEYLHNINLIDIDPKSQLQEISYKLIQEPPKYKILSRVGSDHSPLFEVEVSVGKYSAIESSNSIKKAQKKAAKLLIHQINSNHE